MAKTSHLSFGRYKVYCGFILSLILLVFHVIWCVLLRFHRSTLFSVVLSVLNYESTKFLTKAMRWIQLKCHETLENLWKNLKPSYKIKYIFPLNTAADKDELLRHWKWIKRNRNFHKDTQLFLQKICVPRIFLLCICSKTNS